jgi:hypothetical protein
MCSEVALDRHDVGSESIRGMLHAIVWRPSLSRPPPTPEIK